MKTVDQCQQKVNSALKSKINNVKIEQAHRIPKRKRSDNKDKSRTIVFKLHSDEGKENVMRNLYQLKDTGYYINKDFSKATLNITARLWDEVKQVRGEGYYFVIKYDRIVTNSGMKWRISLFS